MDINQDERNLGMLAHGLVAITGLGSILGSLGGLGFLASIASVVLYFVWKSKSPFVVRHLKQAAGLQAFLFIFGIILGILGAIVALGSLATVGIGGAMATGGLLGIISLAIGIATLILGVMGLMQAQKGEAYTYPVIGQWIDNLNI